MKESLIMNTAKKKFFLTIIFLASITVQNLASAKIEATLGNIKLDENPNLPMKVPFSNEPEIILSREQYVISYNKNKRAPNWVAWKLESGQMGSSGRSNNFTKDIELDNYLTLHSPNSLPAVDHTEYKGSCFDRGHQIPSADRTDSIKNNQTTFYMSNMVPQTPFLNRISWAHLEQYSRDLVQKQGKKLYVIAGPVYDEDFGAIGANRDIQIPSKEFKIIFILNNNEELDQINDETPVISVLMPNTLKNGSKPLENRSELCAPLKNETNDNNDWLKYKTSISEIEKLSGLKFFK